MGEESASLWVFGYGSLCWNPGFDHGRVVIGHVQGFARRFWQGNTTHRGTPGKPGRVATLLEDQSAITHGVAFELLGDAALSYLDQRECTLGGYETQMAQFHPREKSMEAFPVLFYVATPKNQHWLGPASTEHLAEQVINCSGNSGHNVEYVVRLADWIRDSLPEVEDNHLFDLDLSIRRKIRERNLCLKALLKECSNCDNDNIGVDQQEINLAQGGVADCDEDKDSFAFASDLGRSNLRCVKM